MSKFDRKCRICGKNVNGAKGEFTHFYLKHKGVPGFERIFNELKVKFTPWNKGKTYKQSRGSGALPAVSVSPDSGVSAEDLILALEVKRDTLSSVIDDLKRMIAKA